jgi:quinol monooxygenase YgiN
MTALFQVTAEVDDLERFAAAFEWIRQEVAHPPGFVSMRFLRDSARAGRVMLLEKWSGADTFMASLREQGPAFGQEFVERCGAAPDNLASTLWLPAGAAPIEAHRGPAAG